MRSGSPASGLGPPTAEPIIEPDRWQRLAEVLTDPARCDKGSHCATTAIPADQAMAQVMIARLSQPHYWPTLAPMERASGGAGSRPD